MQYTRDQASVIMAPLGDAAIIAAAGSGKSQTAAARIAYLIRKHKLAPLNIVALTFGKQASVNLTERIIHLIKEKIDGPVIGLPDLFAGTVHSWAMHVLKAHVSEFRKFEVLGEAERRLLVRRRFDHLCIGHIPRIAAGTKVEHGSNFLTISPEDVALFLAAIDRARDECLPNEALPPQIRYSFHLYNAVLAREASWDYAGLIQTLLSALTDAHDADCLALQNDIRQHLRVVICDEAQDLDKAMWRLLIRLRELGVSVWCIGDHRQSVYRWRSADPETFLAFPSQGDVRTYSLSSNFRSSGGVVDLADSFAQRFLGERESAAMQAASHHQHEHGDIAAVRFSTQKEQYQWVARRLKILLGVPWCEKADAPARGLSQADMAVLVRTRKQMAEVTAALKAEGLNVIVNGAEGLLAPPEAEALATAVDYLGGGRASWNRKQNCPDLAAVTEDDVRVATQNAFDLSNEAAERGVEWLRALPSAPDWDRPLCLIEVLESWLQAMGVQFVENGSAHEEARWLAIRRVLDAAAAYQRWGFASPLRTKVAGFSRWLRIEAGSVLKDTDLDQGLRAMPDAVVVQTCHNAKGLEYAVVAVPELAEGWFPARPRPSDLWQVLPRQRLTPDQARRLDGTVLDKMRDEANLFYVSLTRSAKYLLLTYAPPEKAKRPRVSPFFEFAERHSSATRDLTLLPNGTAPEAERLPVLSRQDAAPIRITATQLASYWACPRQFYLRFIVNLPPPLLEEIGFGRGLHDAAWEIHRRRSAGEEISPVHAQNITARHFHLPFAGNAVRANLIEAASNALGKYLSRHQCEPNGRTILAEQDVRLQVGLLCVMGRVDLVTNDENNSRSLVELKTASDRERDPNQMVAKTYALAFRETTGVLPDKVETRTISGDPKDDQVTSMTSHVVAATRKQIEAAGVGISRGRFSPLPLSGSKTCLACDVRFICGHQQAPRVKKGVLSVPEIPIVQATPQHGERELRLS